jgi:hypothetical protein
MPHSSGTRAAASVLLDGPLCRSEFVAGWSVGSDSHSRAGALAQRSAEIGAP